MTLVVAMRNEATTIERCVRSILDQDYPGRLEILVADGRSTDQSRAVVAGLIVGHPHAHVLDNPGITQAAGWNLGIDAATGDIVGIVSGHAWLARDYVTRAVDALQRTGADMVGGPVRSVGQGSAGEAIALAGRSRFGVGGASFRYLDRVDRVDTVYMGLCRRELYRRLKFDERMVRNQDDELSYRLLDEGGVIVCDPAIRSWYLNRSRIGDLWSQYRSYGFWKVRVLARHPRQARPRHLIPAGMILAIVAPLLVAPARPLGAIAASAMAAVYGLANVMAASRTAIRADRPELIPLVSAAFAAMHLGYGTGMLEGVIREAVAALRRRA